MIRTLIVDDDFRVADVHRGYVERLDGFRVVGEAHTAGEALKSIQRLRPDLVLLDLYLPDLPGHDDHVGPAHLKRLNPPQNLEAGEVRQI